MPTGAGRYGGVQARILTLNRSALSVGPEGGLIPGERASLKEIGWSRLAFVILHYVASRQGFETVGGLDHQVPVGVDTREGA